MAGSQVILHNRDDAPQQLKDVTRNLGLQSIIYNENASVGLAVKNANTINAIIEEISDIIFSLYFQLEDYIEVSNKIYYLLQNAYYTNSTRTQRLIELQNGAKRFY